MRYIVDNVLDESIGNVCGQNCGSFCFVLM